jgi:hypothetical protein
MLRPMLVAMTTTLFLASIGASQEPAKQASPEEAPKKVGMPGTGRVLRPGEEAGVVDNDTPAATSAGYLELVIKAKAANDQIGIEQLAKSSTGYLLPAGTRVRVIKVNYGKVETVSSEAFARELRAGGYGVQLETTEIRILEGPLKDKAFFVPIASLGQLRVPPPDPAVIAREKREAKEAADKLAKAKALAERPNTMLRLAKNYEKNRNTKAALDAYRKIVAEYPASEAANDAAERIKALDGK